MPSVRASRRYLTALAIVLLASALAPLAYATNFTVTFGSLPSTQGWSYFSNGVVAPETPTWALSGGVLSYNTMPYAVGLSGQGTSSMYRQLGLVNTTEPIVMEMRGRILEFENDGSAFISGGFSFGFTQGTTAWTMGILPTQIRNINNVVLSSAYDNTQFHTYRLEWTPPSSVRFYVDGTLISTNSGGFASSLNQIYFGDGTGASNARAEITSFRFLQGAATATDASSWGRIKSLYQ